MTSIRAANAKPGLWITHLTEPLVSAASTDNPPPPPRLSAGGTWATLNKVINSYNYRDVMKISAQVTDRGDHEAQHRL